MPVQKCGFEYTCAVFEILRFTPVCSGLLQLWTLGYGFWTTVVASGLSALWAPLETDGPDLVLASRKQQDQHCDNYTGAPSVDIAPWASGPQFPWGARAPHPEHDHPPGHVARASPQTPLTLPLAPYPHPPSVILAEGPS